MLARIPFGLTTGPIEGAEILVAGCRKETVASEMRSNVLKYRDTLMIRRGQTTPLQERLEITERASAAESDPEIAAALGCSVWTVRK